jgi:thioredoxin reductase (NADPH)
MSTTDTNVRPTLLVVGESAMVRTTVEQLRNRYGDDYAIEAVSGEAEAIEQLRAGDDVALVLLDRSLHPSELWSTTRRLHPRARRLLLLEWNEHRSHREEIAAAIAGGDVDFYVVRPGGHPDERFHRAIVELLDEWWRHRGGHADSIRVIGDERSARTHEICDALHRHDMPYRLEPPASRDAQSALAAAGVPAEVEGPVIVLRNGTALVDPTNREIAAALGARIAPREGVYDVLIVGGGPAGLAAAVYASSEGLRVGLAEREAMGGQAGTSSLIRNYLGFPRGISGAELADRSFNQAIQFGTEMIFGADAASLRADGDLRVVGFTDGTEVRSHTVVIATGVTYRRLDVPALEPFQGISVFYGAGMSEASRLEGRPVVVVGGGNSAGQAALFLARYASQVTLLVRSESLAASMSDYLVNDLDVAPNVEIRYRGEVVDGGGEGQLEWLDVRDATGRVERMPAAALFVLIGASPHTEWLPPEVARDEWGYVITDTGRGDHAVLFETTLPGVFAVGDVRAGGIKRVAAATGDGAICVRSIHQYLSSSTTVQR